MKIFLLFCLYLSLKRDLKISDTLSSVYFGWIIGTYRTKRNTYLLNQDLWHTVCRELVLACVRMGKLHPEKVQEIIEARLGILWAGRGKLYYGAHKQGKLPVVGFLARSVRLGRRWSAAIKLGWEKKRETEKKKKKKRIAALKFSPFIQCLAVLPEQPGWTSPPLQRRTL